MSTQSNNIKSVKKKLSKIWKKIKKLKRWEGSILEIKSTSHSQNNQFPEEADNKVQRNVGKTDAYCFSRMLSQRIDKLHEIINQRIDKLHEIIFLMYILI